MQSPTQKDAWGMIEDPGKKLKTKNFVPRLFTSCRQTSARLF